MPFALLPRPPIVIARALKGFGKPNCTHAGPPSFGAGIVSRVFS